MKDQAAEVTSPIIAFRATPELARIIHGGVDFLEVSGD